MKNWVSRQPRGELDGPVINKIGQYEGTQVPEQIGKNSGKQLQLFPLCEPGKWLLLWFFKVLWNYDQQWCLGRENFSRKFKGAYHWGILFCKIIVSMKFIFYFLIFCFLCLNSGPGLANIWGFGWKIILMGNISRE